MSEGGYAMGGADDGLDLSFGPDSVEPDSYDPCPVGTWNFFVDGPPEVTQTKERKETMLAFQLKALEDQGEASNKVVKYWLVVPGQAAKQEDQKKWNQRMNMLRRDLEAITGQPWREDNMKLNPRQLAGARVKASIVHEAAEWTDKTTGQKRTGVNANVDRLMAYDGLPGGPSSSTGEAPSSPATSGGFRL